MGDGRLTTSKFQAAPSHEAQSSTFQRRPFAGSVALQEREEAEQESPTPAAASPTTAPIDIPLFAPPPVQRAEETALEDDEQEELPLQTKLTIGAPGDKYEQEADATAASVMAMPVQRQADGLEEDETDTLQQRPAITPLVQRQAMVGKEKTNKDDSLTQLKPLVQAKGGAKGAPQGFEQRLNRHRGGGQPLSDETKAFMEPRFGADFGGVRVHEAPKEASDIGAQAFTHGQDIYFNSGKYNPGSSGGKELLAHELTHTIQQTGGAHLKRDRPQSSTVQNLPVQRTCPKCEAEQKANKVQARFEVKHHSERQPVILSEDQSVPNQTDALSEDSLANLSEHDAIEDQSFTDNNVQTGNRTQVEDRAENVSDALAEESLVEPDAVLTNQEPESQVQPSGEEAEADEVTTFSEPSISSVAATQTAGTPESQDTDSEVAQQLVGAAQEQLAGEAEGAEESVADEVNETAAEDEAAVEDAKAETAADTEEAESEAEETKAEADQTSGNTEPLATEAPGFKLRQPKAMFATTQAGLAKFKPQEVLGFTSDNLVLFQTSQPETVETLAAAQSSVASGGKPPDGLPPDDFLHRLGDEEAAQISGQQQQQASMALAQFVASGSAQLQQVNGLGQTVQPRIQAAAAQARATVDAAIQQNQAAITGAIAQARSRVQGQAAQAKSQLNGQHSSAIADIQAATATARQRIEAEYTASTERLAQLEQEIPQRVDLPFEIADEDFRNAGVTVGQEATDKGHSRREQYLSEPLPETSKTREFFEGADYHRNRRQAKADAAIQVAQAYNDELVAEGGRAADQLPESKGEVTAGFQSQIDNVRTQLDAKYSAALNGLVQAEQQSIALADETLNSQLGTVDQQLTTTLVSLDQIQTTQLNELNAVGEQQKLLLDQTAQRTTATLQDGINQACEGLQTTFQGLIAEAGSIEAPDIAMLSIALAEAQGQLDQAIASTQTELETGLSTSEQGMLQQGQQTANSLNVLGQQATSQGSAIADNFATCMAEVTQSASQTFTQLKDGHATTVNAQADSVVADLKQQITDLENSFEEIGRNLSTELSNSATQLESELRGALNDLDSKISEEANKAADEVQPSWKGWVKIIISVVIAIVVTVAIIALAASGVGLVAAIGLAALIGAAGGLAEKASHDLVDGKTSSWEEYAQAAGIGAVTGVLSLVGIRGASHLLQNAGGKLATNKLLQVGAETAIDTTSDVAIDVAHSVLSGEELTSSMLLRSAAISLALNGGSQGIVAAWRRVRSPRVDVNARIPDVDTRTPEINIKTPDIKSPDVEAGSLGTRTTNARASGRGPDIQSPNADIGSSRLKPPELESPTGAKADAGIKSPDAETRTVKPPDAADVATKRPTADGHEISVTKNGDMIQCGEGCKIIDPSTGKPFGEPPRPLLDHTGKPVGEPPSPLLDHTGKPVLMTPSYFRTLPGTGNIDPKTIRFSQDSIAAKFKGPYGSIDDLIEGLKKGTIDSSSIAPIRIVQWEDGIYTLDNRRLYAFQQAGKPVRFIKLEAVPKRETFKFTTNNSGKEISVRRPRENK